VYTHDDCMVVGCQACVAKKMKKCMQCKDNFVLIDGICANDSGSSANYLTASASIVIVISLLI